VHTPSSRFASAWRRLAILLAVLASTAIFVFASASERCAASQTATTTTLTSTPNASIYGASVTFTATISPSVPAGETVTFYDSGTQIGTGTTASSKATFVTAALIVGSHSITATYSGDSNYATSTSSVLTQSVVICHPTTALASALNPSTKGASVTFTATINQSVPNGETVTFYQGVSSKTSIGTGTTSGGVAMLAISTLALGSNTIWAYYPGDSNYAYSWSGSVVQTVNQAPTATTLASSVNPSAYGGSVTFTASISPSVPNYETVTFYDGGASIGTGATSGGAATLTTSSFAAGTHNITASYPGDTNYVASTSSALTQTVNQATTTTGISSSPNPSGYGASVTFNAWVRPIGPNGETITFYDGSTQIGTGTTSGGSASLTTLALAVGSHSVTAAYTGDATYAPSTSSALTQTVNIVQPVTVLTSSLNPSTFGSAVTFSASVSPSVPNGESVTFYQGAGSKTAIGSGMISGGVATLTTTALAQGGYTIWAYYPGDSNFHYSWSSPLTQTVNQAPATTTLASPVNPSTFEESVTFTATVSPSVPDWEIVTFYYGGVSLGTGYTSGGIAALTTYGLPVGCSSVTASYPGDSNYAASTSSALEQTVNPDSTFTGIESLPNPSNYGDSVTFTAWVRPIVPNGETVTFYDGGEPIGAGTISGGTAMFSTSTLALGPHSITAGYNDDADYESSMSSTLTQTVDTCHPTTTLVSSMNPSALGSAVTFTATITPSVPDGESIIFYDGVVSKATIGTGTTSGGVATFTTSALALGSHTISAQYVGDANYAYSWSAGLPQSVHQASTTTLVSSLNPSTFGVSVSFTATVSPAVPNTEVLTFYDGGSSIGTATTASGVATLTTSALAAGSHSITATYPGDTK